MLLTKYVIFVGIEESLNYLDVVLKNAPFMSNNVSHKKRNKEGELTLNMIACDLPSNDLAILCKSEMRNILENKGNIKFDQLLHNFSTLEIFIQTQDISK
jgi:hypothetical protein